MRRYGGRWFEDKNRCAVEVACWDGGGNRKQCGNKRGYGPGKIYCRVHARQVAVGEQPAFGVPGETH